jgi:peptide/nickel transport system substrate-binding protein
MKKFLLLALSLIIIASLTLVSCGKGETTPTATPTKPATTTATPTPTTAKPSATSTAIVPTMTSPEPNGLGDLAKPSGGKSGGRLRLVSAGNILNIGNIKNAIAGPGDAAYAWPCCEPLIRWDGSSFQPWLAEKYEIASDYSSFTFYLRKGVKFHDGTPFNAEAVKTVLDIAIASPIYSQGHCFETPVIIDDYTIKVAFKDGKWNWDGAKGLATWWGMLMFSPRFLESNSDEELKLGAVGTGPFILKEYLRDQKLIYDKNPDYWRGEPYFDGIDYDIIPNSSTQLLAFEAGEVDYIGVQLKDINRLTAKGYNIITSEDACFNYCLLPDSANPESPLANLKVRQAVQYAIDQSAIIEGITYGYGKPAQQEFALDPYRDPTVVGYPYDPDKAKELLKEAGYDQGLNLNMWMNEAVPMDAPLALQDMLNKVGITITFKKVSIIQFGAMIQAGGSGWDGFIYTYAFPGKTIDPGFTANLYMNTGAWPSTLKPPEIKALIDQGAVEPDIAKRTAIYQQVSRMMTEQCLRQYVYLSGSYTTVNPKLAGYTMGQYTQFFDWTYAYFK